MSARIPVTFLIPAFNEETRIRRVLDHAVRWADEVVVADKSSTDTTREICREYGSRVRIVDLPFSPKGHDDLVSLVGETTNDWIFIGTASEIPTRKLIRRARTILDDTNGTLDLVYVPRKMYAFGIHSARSPWAISYYPFLINRKKAVIRNIIHSNFSPTNPLNIARIEYADDCCVHHFTHRSAEHFLQDTMQYVRAEADGTPLESVPLRRSECQKHREQYERLLVDGGEDLFGHYCAWQIYWLGTALFLWEKQRGIDVPARYEELGTEILNREWLSPHAGSAPIQPEVGPSATSHGRPRPRTKIRVLYSKACYLIGMVSGTAKRILFRRGSGS